jgi:hypothetical protein
VRWIGVSGSAAISNELIEVERGGHGSLLNLRLLGVVMFAQIERQDNNTRCLAMRAA